MPWQKRGLIYNVDNRIKWASNSVMTPTPFLISENVIRVYASFRDDVGRGRIGYVDLDAMDPQKILKISKAPVLDIGEKGMFDDNGMILGDVICVGDEMWMYYVGFQHVANVKFFASSGLAISKDGGENFNRYQKTPILDRTDNAPFGRAVHTVMRDDNKFRVWYAAMCGWRFINDVPYPEYYIRCTESKDGKYFPDSEGIECLRPNVNEYRLGRPMVKKKTNGKYEMRFTYDTLQKEYKMGYAESTDGINWIRIDDVSNIVTTSTVGWDSEMTCYPATITIKDKTYMFYNGNGMGKTGFGYAQLDKCEGGGVLLHVNVEVYNCNNLIKLAA